VVQETGDEGQGDAGPKKVEKEEVNEMGKKEKENVMFGAKDFRYDKRGDNWQFCRTEGGRT
jgi:hypothetical protein